MNYIKMKITYREQKEIINRYTFESNERFNKRLKFIKVLEEHNFSWKDAVKFSKLWYNIIYNKCKYNQELYLIVIKYNKLIK